MYRSVGVTSRQQRTEDDILSQRFLTRAAWIQQAVQAAIADADTRAGRRPPTLPTGTRLPNQPRKTRTQ